MHDAGIESLESVKPGPLLECMPLTPKKVFSESTAIVISPVLTILLEDLFLEHVLCLDLEEFTSQAGMLLIKVT